MADSLDRAEKLVQKYANIIEKYGVIFSIEPMTQMLQVIFVPNHVAKSVANFIRDKWMYHKIETGEIGLSKSVAEMAGLEDRVQQTYNEEQAATMKAIFDMAKYFSPDNSDWLKDLGLEEDSEDAENPSDN